MRQHLVRTIVSCGLTLLLAVTAAWGERPPPDAVAQAAARTLIHSLFREEYAHTDPASRRALAQRLLREASATRDDPAARFVLFEEAADLASAAGDLATALSALNLQAQDTLLDLLSLQTRAALRAQNAAQPDASPAVARACLALLDDAIAADRFDLGDQLAKAAANAADRARQVALAADVQRRLTRYRTLAVAFANVENARRILQQHPNDPAANCTIGRFYCLLKGQWHLGLPAFARGGQEPWNTLARQELASPVDGAAQVQLADAWWALADTLSGSDQAAVRAHAADCYRTAAASIAGLTLTRIQTRLRQVATQPAATRPADLLAQLTPAREAVAGDWTLTNGRLACDASAYARLQLPVPPQEYILTVTFTRTSGNGPIALLLLGPGRDEARRPFGLCLDASGHIARLETVRGRAHKDNPTEVPCKLDTGKSYTLRVEVRRDRFRAWLDDRSLINYPTDYQDLGRYAPWKLKESARLGLGAHRAQVQFEKVELVEITESAGKAAP